MFKIINWLKKNHLLKFGTASPFYWYPCPKLKASTDTSNEKEIMDMPEGNNSNLINDWERERIIDRLHSSPYYKDYVRSFLKGLNRDLDLYIQNQPSYKTSGSADILENVHKIIEDKCLKNGINPNDLFVRCGSRRFTVRDKDLFAGVWRYRCDYLSNNEISYAYAEVKKGRTIESEFWANRGFVKEKLELYNNVNSTKTKNFDFGSNILNSPLDRYEINITKIFDDLNIDIEVVYLSFWLLILIIVLFYFVKRKN